MNHVFDCRLHFKVKVGSYFTTFSIDMFQEI